MLNYSIQMQNLEQDWIQRGYSNTAFELDLKPLLTLPSPGSIAARPRDATESGLHSCSATSVSVTERAGQYY